MLEKLKCEAYNSALEIIEIANLKEKDILVIGCSTSEIVGDTIGTNSSPDAAKAVFDGIYTAANEKGVFVAAQCCEHLNRAIVIEADAVAGLDIVNVVPQPKAGGSFATAAYNTFKNPVVVEEIGAKAGLDIGFTMIGMHIKRVAVPVRLKNNKIGNATVLAARHRPKFIGGVRAHYDESLT
jgi:uncharacterized protein (TIGR01440 family)